MRKAFSTILLVLLCLAAMAVPADRTPLRVRLLDGSTITVFHMGDEHHSWFQTADGIVVEQVAPEVYKRTSRPAEQEARKALSARTTSMRRAPRRVGSAASAPLPVMGSPRVPVILVNFADSVFSVADTDEGIREYYDLYCNGTRDGQLYKGHGSYGSIRDYFSDQSYGQFTPEFTIFGPVTVSREEAFYGRDSGSHDTQYNQFVVEAIDSVTRNFHVDWSQFDNKGLGQVDMVFLIYAGCGQNTSSHSTDIWPNERPVGRVELANGKSLYFVCSGCCSERAIRKKTVNDQTVPYAVIDGIGVMCHELSHAIGLPDFYDYGYRAYGMDLWSLMDYGCYAGQGYTPCAYTAYERDFMGWRQLVSLDHSWGEYTVAPISDDGFGYKVVNEENEDEYYVLENRQAVNWDSSLGLNGHGLQVTHVDYSAGFWFSNSVNAIANHQRMTVISANGLYHGTTEYQNGKCTLDELYDCWAGTLYPFVADGVVMNDSLTAFSTPAATVYTASGYMSQGLHAIRENADKSVSFYFGNDYVDAIDRLTASGSALDRSVYDLSGRPVDTHASLRPGIYICGGRKRLVK